MKIRFKIKDRFRTQKYLRQELARLIRQNDYLKDARERQMEKEAGYRELIKIYEALIVYLGEGILEKGLKNDKNYEERMGKIISLLK